MKLTGIFIVLIIMSASVLAQDYSIDWYVIGSGGGESQSENYQINGTIGQPVVGFSSSVNYIVESGFWVGAGGPSCYNYFPGDVNMGNGSWPPAVIGSDVTYLVNFFRGITAACLLDGFYAAADINGDCSVIGSDVTRLVNYFRGMNEVSWCPDYEPCWHTIFEIPANSPADWPDCDPEPSITSSKVIPGTDQ